MAGITVETDGVVIDLNGHEIKQSLALYHQQRFFSYIALKSVVFPLTQGPGLMANGNALNGCDGNLMRNEHFLSIKVLSDCLARCSLISDGGL